MPSSLTSAVSLSLCFSGTSVKTKNKCACVDRGTFKAWTWVQQWLSAQTSDNEMPGRDVHQTSSSSSPAHTSMFLFSSAELTKTIPTALKPKTKNDTSATSSAGLATLPDI